MKGRGDSSGGARGEEAYIRPSLKCRACLPFPSALPETGDPALRLQLPPNTHTYTHTHRGEVPFLLPEAAGPATPAECRSSPRGPERPPPPPETRSSTRPQRATRTGSRYGTAGPPSGPDTAGGGGGGGGEGEGGGGQGKMERSTHYNLHMG